jgi:hypothetical protein
MDYADKGNDAAEDTQAQPLDKKALEREAVAGAKAYNALAKHAGEDWRKWHDTICGLRALVLIAQHDAGTSDMKAQAYRDAMQRLLGLQKYAAYSELPKPTSSNCYQLMWTIEDVSRWYDAQDASFKLRVKHPSSVLKHVPRNLLTVPGHNSKPAGKNGKRKNPKPVDPEIERLRKAIVELVKAIEPLSPELAKKALDQVYPPDDDGGDLDDGADDI